MLVARTTTVAALLVLAGCGGSSTPDTAAESGSPAASAPASAAAPSPSALRAQPAPKSFPVGEYARTVKLQGELDGRWRLLLKADGHYQFVSPQSTSGEGTFAVSGTQIIFTDAECGIGGYTFTATSSGLRFAAVGNDGCADDRGPLLNGQEWSKA